MKVQVITRHTPINYGSLLQSIATQKIFEACDCECQIIDYFRTDEEYGEIEKTILRNKKSWNSNPLKRGIYLALRVPASIHAGKKFRAMQYKYLHLTQRYSSNQELRDKIEDADYYVTGSDQVWGKIACGEYDSSYFLDFVKDDSKKISFASSMGHATKTPEEEKLFVDSIRKYHHVAVREDSVVEYFKGLGIEAEQVLDPTLMIDGDEWRKYEAKKPNGKYVLIYQIHNDKKLGKYAKEYAKKKGLPLVRVSQNFHQILREGNLRYVPDVSEFLSLIDNADTLVTDSFHGTAFAINLNTDFVEILPNTNTGSRNQSILRLLGLTDRIVQDMNDYSLLDKKIDYSVVNEKLNCEREKSFDVLKKFLEK
ncbi:Polysaccharide pyruvyl transferase [Pseudobutyrivibrio sp. 49]|uniref:polysaccharide pyruvyl transferase family protein n=1 Tax=Pseudobutyrivibrio sp. 49 TaxID=1855344 RepID=UPI000883DF7E|nr:polysaccharide pyruvyl transferase family protein [Pseudobutyrivibrio sp. 49]SDI72216.1 Polysaccharide pyruvyl transferase [Pseudobutyrivibrio sp. 49]